MTRLSLKSIAALLSVLTADPAFAQAAIQEPGAFTFNYPNRDVLNGGALTPAGKLAAEPSAAAQAYLSANARIGARHLQRHRSHHTGR